MSRNRLTLEDVSKMSPALQAQVAAQLYPPSTGPGFFEVSPPPPAVTGAAPKRKPGEAGAGGLPVPSESYQQQDLIVWWRVACVAHGLDERVLMGFPLQGARTKANASRLKAEGMRAGTPDLLLAVARPCFGGLWIEMKTHRKGSKLSASQKMMLKILSRQYKTVVCRSTAEAQAAITTYLTR